MKFPTTREEVATTRQQFYEYCRFPGVLGAIDGIHVYIKSPGGNNALYFINRKNRFSINVQVSSLTLVYMIFHDHVFMPLTRSQYVFGLSVRLSVWESR